MLIWDFKLVNYNWSFSSQELFVLKSLIRKTVLMLYKNTGISCSITNLKIPEEFLADFPMLQLIHEVALFKWSQYSFAINMNFWTTFIFSTNCANCTHKKLYLIKIYLGYNSKPANTQISCNIRKSAKYPEGIFG